jgi:hypothetical protein
LATGGLFGERERPRDSLGDEVEGRDSLHLDRLAWVMGNDEHVVV